MAKHAGHTMPLISHTFGVLFPINDTPPTTDFPSPLPPLLPLHALLCSVRASVSRPGPISLRVIYIPWRFRWWIWWLQHPHFLLLQRDAWSSSITASVYDVFNPTLWFMTRDAISQLNSLPRFILLFHVLFFSFFFICCYFSYWPTFECNLILLFIGNTLGINATEESSQ